MRRLLLLVTLFCSGCAMNNKSYASGTTTSTSPFVHLNWTAGIGDLAFNVYRSSGSCPLTVSTITPGFTLIGSTALTTYVDTPGSVGVWCYFVTGTQGTLESAPSNDVDTTLELPAPLPPMNLLITVTLTA